MSRCCELLARAGQMLRNLWSRLSGRSDQYREALLSQNVEDERVHEVSQDSARVPLVSQEELARILGNSVPMEHKLANKEAPEDLERQQEEFLETVQGSGSQAAFLAVQSATTEIVNASDECVGSALHFIAAEGHVEACRALLSRCDFTQVNARNGIGSTALHIAAANDEEEICKMILEDARFTAGADVANNNGQTPMDFAAEFGTGLCLGVLQAAGGRHGTRRRRGREIYTRIGASALAAAQSEEVTDMNGLD